MGSNSKIRRTKTKLVLEPVVELAQRQRLAPRLSWDVELGEVPAPQADPGRGEEEIQKTPSPARSILVMFLINF